MEFSEKQLQIIETAEQLFADNGFAGTSVRDIAEKASVNVAMISYYFGSKEKLLEAMFTYRAGDTTAKLESMLQNREMKTLDKFNMLIDYYIDKFQLQPCFFRIMMREQVAFHKSVTTSLIHHFKKRNQQLIKQLVQEGQKSGEFIKHIDVPMLMATLIGTVSHLVTTQHYYKEINDLQDMPEEQFQKHLRKKLSTHLKSVFKAILTHEV